jgi:hypothetical protein
MYSKQQAVESASSRIIWGIAGTYIGKYSRRGF